MDAPSKAPDTPSFSESPRRRPEGRSSSAKERTNRFRMAPVSGLLFCVLWVLCLVFVGAVKRRPAPCIVSKRSWKFLFEEGGLFLREYLNPGLVQVPAGWVKDEYLIRLIDRVGAEAFWMFLVFFLTYHSFFTVVILFTLQCGKVVCRLGGGNIARSISSAWRRVR